MIVATAILLIVFLFAFGLLFLWLAKNESAIPSEPKSKFFGRLFNAQFVLVMFALLYLSLAHFTMYGALALGLEYDLSAPCDNVLVKTEYHYVNETAQNPSQTANNLLNKTIMFYADTCDNITYANEEYNVTALPTPPLTENYFTLFTWLLYLDMLVIGLGATVLIFKFLSRM